MKLIDLTHKIEDLLPEYPGDEETRLVNTRKLKTDGYTNQQASYRHAFGHPHRLPHAFCRVKEIYLRLPHRILYRRGMHN